MPKVREATALGAAILAGTGVGIFQDIRQTAKELCHIESTYYPDASNHDTYDKLYKTWKEVYRAQLELADRKLTKNMWIAPGL